MPRLKLRHLAAVCALMWLVGASILAAGVAAGYLDGILATVLAVGLIIVAVGVVTGLGIRRVLVQLRQHRRLLEGTRNKVDGTLSAVSDTLTELRKTLTNTRDSIAEDRIKVYLELRETNQEVGRIKQELGRATVGLKKLDGAVLKIPGQLTKYVTDVLGAAEAREDVRSLIAARAPLPTLGGWALDPRVMRTLALAILRRPPKLVVECGSGSSTIWIGYLLERIGSGQLVTLEHDERFFALARDLVVAHGLQNQVDVRWAPLQSWTDPESGESYKWYATAAIADLSEIDVLLVDGPPARSGHWARYPAGPLLLPRCTVDAFVILDDAERDDEKALSERWIESNPALEREVVTPLKVHTFRFRQQAAQLNEPVQAPAKGGRV